MPVPSSEPDTFGPGDPQGAAAYYRDYGFVVLRGFLEAAAIDRMQAECVQAQDDVVAGRLDPRHGSTVFLDVAAKAERFANYVEYVQDVAPSVAAASTDRGLVELVRTLLGADCWLRDDHQFGIVYQDARPGRDSGYARIGWHSDWQASPSKAIWPATAFTIHLDATSPANGFLRVVPGSHRWATPAPYRNINNVVVPDTALPAGGHTDEPPPVPMPLGFDKVPGEIPVYAERGDVLLHDGYLWHSAARATDDEALRRHVRGGYYTGDKVAEERTPEFIKNAAR